MRLVGLNTSGQECKPPAEDPDLDVFEKVKAVFGEVISGVDIASITAESTMDTVDGWDSMRFLEIVIHLETAFDVKFGPGEVARMFSINNIVEIIGSKDDPT